MYSGFVREIPEAFLSTSRTLPEDIFDFALKNPVLSLTNKSSYEKIPDHCCFVRLPVSGKGAANAKAAFAWQKLDGHHR